MTRRTARARRSSSRPPSTRSASFRSEDTLEAVTGWPFPAILVMIPFALGYATMRLAESRRLSAG